MFFLTGITAKTCNYLNFIRCSIDIDPKYWSNIRIRIQWHQMEIVERKMTWSGISGIEVWKMENTRNPRKIMTLSTTEISWPSQRFKLRTIDIPDSVTNWDIEINLEKYLESVKNIPVSTNICVQWLPPFW